MEVFISMDNYRFQKNSVILLDAMLLNNCSKFTNIVRVAKTERSFTKKSTTTYFLGHVTKWSLGNVFENSFPATHLPFIASYKTVHQVAPKTTMSL